MKDFLRAMRRAWRHSRPANSVEELARRYRDMEPEFLEIWLACQSVTAASIERSYALYKAVEHVSRAKIEGDFVECGVWRGGQAMLAAMAFQRFGSPRRLVLYDTYAGMPRPSTDDFERGRFRRPALRKWERLRLGEYSDWVKAPLDEVKANMARTDYPEKLIRYVEGKVEDTLPSHDHREIAILRLDTDFYESTRAEMEHLYPLLRVGGVLLLDDYGHWAGAQKAVDEYFLDHPSPPFLCRPDYAGRTAIKARPCPAAKSVPEHVQTAASYSN